MQNVNDFIRDIVTWGWTTGILEQADAKSQALKTVSEVGEMCDNIAKGRDIKDDIGDILVTLILQCEIQKFTIEECLEVAYNEIKGRKGKMINGVFIKEGDI